MNNKAMFAAFIVLGIAAYAGIIAFSMSSDRGLSDTTEYTVPGESAMSPDIAEALFYRLTPALLLEVYNAFEKTEEGEIYDTLATVTHGDALEHLYLERASAMSGGGIEAADQTIHEIRLEDASVEREGRTLNLSAQWQVIGTVGHAEHLHVRGNTYSANLSVSPIDGAWRITEFDLLDVNRDMAGTTFLEDEQN